MPPPCSNVGPLHPASDGVRLLVRLSPRARAERLDGVMRLADGADVLKASVTAPPADGRANEALLRLLAKEWNLPRRDLAIVGGHKSRSKLVHISGNTAALLAGLTGALAALPRS